MSANDNAPVPADILIHARWVVPVEPAAVVHENHSLAISGGRIAGLLPRQEAERRYRAAETVELPGHVLLPGLVNAHTHAAMSLMRGLADDLPLMQWLQEHVWPVEGRHVSAEFCRDGVQLAVAELLKGGVTFFNDMYFFPDVTAQVAAQAGLRACIGLILLDFPSVWAQGPDEYLDKAAAVHDAWRDHPLVRTVFGPHAPYTVSDKPLERMRVLADELDIPIQMHVHETAFEVEEALKQTGRRPLARLRDLGLLTPALLAVHMTQLTNDEIRLCAETGLHVVHCPESNLKLASGFCPAGKLLAAGVNVALGTDGAASNNDLDLLGEMRTAALLAKAVAGNASTLPAHTALRLATLNGARALGLGDEIGSLEPGKWADVCAIELDRIETQPLYSVPSQIVYAAGRRQVSDVWVAGRRLLNDRRLTTLDEDAILARAHEWGRRIAATDAA
jgi:5-methylthioadenosine/S-adenosylhomocysteine deaminase